jgi:hypothetical protein
MKQLDINQMALLDGGGFFDGFCTAVGVFSAGYGLAVLAGLTVATGGVAASIWSGTVAGCALYGVYVLVK